MLKLIEFSHSHHSSVVKMVAKFIRRGIRKVNISKEYKVGFLNKLFGVGDAEKCPVCGSVLHKDNPSDYKCPKCNICFHKDHGVGELMTAEELDRRIDQRAGTCENCQQSLRFGDFVHPWEQGNNSNAYVTCPHCGHENIKYGYGEDED